MNFKITEELKLTKCVCYLAMLSITENYALLMDKWTSLEHWWNDSDIGTAKYMGNNLS